MQKREKGSERKKGREDGRVYAGSQLNLHSSLPE